MMLFGVLTFVLVVAALLYFWNERTQQNQSEVYPDASTETALDIVRKRYARGEITRDEYNEIRQDLAHK